MTTLTYTSTQSWTAPSDCRGIDSVEGLGAGANGAAGPVWNNAATVPGGVGGGGGARSIAYNVPCSPGEQFTIYVGAANAQTYSGLYSATRGWLCLAYSAQGQTGGKVGWGAVGSYASSGSDGGAGQPSNFAVQYGGDGGAGGQSDYGGGGAGGVGSTDDGGAGSGGSTYGAGGGGGAGSGAFGLNGGAGGVGVGGFTKINYTPYIPRPPTVTALSKNSGSPGGGQTLTVTGTNFDNSVSAVKFGTTNAASFTVVSATQITVVTPQHTAGQYDVTVTNVDGSNPSTPADYFTFKAPVVFSIPMGGI